MILSAKAQAAIKAKLATRGNSENLDKLGPLGEFLTAFGATKWSPIRQKNGNPYIVLYDANDAPFTLMFSNRVTALHNTTPFEKSELLDNPVYLSEAKDAAGNTATYFTIGIEGVQPDDIENIDFKALGLEAQPARQRNQRTPVK